MAIRCTYRYARLYIVARYATTTTCIMLLDSAHALLPTIAREAARARLYRVMGVMHSVPSNRIFVQLVLFARQERYGSSSFLIPVAASWLL